MTTEKSFVAANWFKLFIVAVVTLAIATYFYRSEQLDACLEEANIGYSERWQKQCVAEKKGKDCDMLMMGSALNKAKDTAIDTCFRRYSFTTK
jgi:ribosomal protein L12E/L44/L45/RPP1/RPP2